MKAEILSIGTELLLGQIENTDSVYIASQLPTFGIDLYWISTVGDNRTRLLDVLKRAWERSDVIITTGGLGPTQGDITREVVAEFLGEKMEVAPELAEKVITFFASRGLEMSENNMKQAMLIPSARPMLNPLGTAPGWWVERDGKIMVILPGPPHEMQLMWEREVSPRLRTRVSEVIFSRTLKTFGLGESRIDEMLGPYLTSSNPTLATYARLDGVQIRITAKGATREVAEEMVSRREAEVRALVGEYVWGVDGDTIEDVLGRRLVEENLTLATVESYTCGGLASILSGAFSSSRFYRGGVVVSCDFPRTAFGTGVLGALCHTQVGPDVAEQMAATVRKELSADIGVGVTGVVGGDGDKADDVYIAIDSGASRRSLVRSYPSYLKLGRKRAVYAALFELRRFLN
ncbi:MAG: CinA family nicotinamide mononucleotide deamidase-related protein [Dehalococcoidia bacterium]|nr:CinA family nicotinamide mononucleotide deamidase-related protein [Dehalococcoidia bacterium]